MKFLICKLFGHKQDHDGMYYMNCQICLRCQDIRSFTYENLKFWTDLEYYGLVGYPIWKIKNYILAIWIWFKCKIGKFKMINKDNDYDPDLPF